MRDLMIDIETLGNRPGSIILSIGAVTFDAETGAIGDDFYASIDSETAAAVGLTSDVSTMIWWLKQSKEASDAAFSGTQPIGAALEDFAAFVLQREPSRVWAKPPSFDLVMIEAAFRACDIQIPWHFATHRDCRTIFDLTATKPTVAGTAHNALDDAKAQALAVIEAYQKLRQAPPENHLQAIANAAQAYVESVDREPEKDCWDTEDGKEAPGALRFASDWAWQEYDVKKQKAFDDLRAALAITNAPSPETNTTAIAAAQITMGRGLVDVSRIEHEGRAGILFRPREKHIPIGDEGELQAGEYWPVEGDVVIWVENEGGAKVIQKYLMPFLPPQTREATP